MTQLCQKMLEELQGRNYSHRTAKTYVRRGPAAFPRTAVYRTVKANTPRRAREIRFLMRKLYLN